MNTVKQLDRLTEAVLPQLVLCWLLSESDYSYQRWLELFNAADSIIDAYTASRKSGGSHE